MFYTSYLVPAWLLIATTTKTLCLIKFMLYVSGKYTLSQICFTFGSIFLEKWFEIGVCKHRGSFIWSIYSYIYCFFFFTIFMILYNSITIFFFRVCAIWKIFAENYRSIVLFFMCVCVCLFSSFVLSFNFHTIRPNYSDWSARKWRGKEIVFYGKYTYKLIQNYNDQLEKLS